MKGVCHFVRYWNGPIFFLLLVYSCKLSHSVCNSAEKFRLQACIEYCKKSHKMWKKNKNPARTYLTLCGLYIHTHTHKEMEREKIFVSPKDWFNQDLSSFDIYKHSQLISIWHFTRFHGSKRWNIKNPTLIFFLCVCCVQCAHNSLQLPDSIFKFRV